MYLCYIDESGTPDIPGNTSHFVLAGISLPIWHWRDADREIAGALKQFGLEGQELHTAWILRNYLEQSRIQNFEDMSWDERRSAVLRERNANLLRLQQSQKRKTYRQTKKNYHNSNAYIHLTKEERQSLGRNYRY
ncbi:MAG: DUF3800 domain-containing protein [Desulfovermiculus sp.]|nr:DUF3800 domain-containing protein [Desulfovermiculus sp.]